MDSKGKILDFDSLEKNTQVTMHVLLSIYRLQITLQPASVLLPNAMIKGLLGAFIYFLVSICWLMISMFTFSFSFVLKLLVPTLSEIERAKTTFIFKDFCIFRLLHLVLEPSITGKFICRGKTQLDIFCKILKIQ